MSPDEEVAVLDPPVEEAVPPEQEQPPAEEIATPAPEGDSGAPAEAEADPRAAFLESLKEAAKDDPDLLAILKEVTGTEGQELSDEEWQQQVQAGKEQRTQVLRQAAAQAQRYAPDALAQSVANYLDQLESTAKGSYKKVRDGQAEDFEFDTRRNRAGLTAFINQAATERTNLIHQGYEVGLIDFLESLPESRRLSQDDHAAIAKAMEDTNPFTFQQKMFAVYLEAARRGAPTAEIEKKATAEAERKAKLADKYNELYSNLPSKKAAQNGATTPPQNDEALLADPNTPIDVIQKIRARQLAAQ